MKQYKLTYLTSLENSQFTYNQDKYILVNDEGTITSISDQRDVAITCIDYSQYLTIPAISDLHLHASQLEISGLGYDLALDQWFETILYPAEASYDNPENYRRINRQLVNRLWDYGIFNSSVFCAIGVDAAKDLMSCFDQAQMNAYVGKMNADVNEQGEAKETLEQSLADTLETIHFAKTLKKGVEAAVTPEFVPTCSLALMKKLGDIANTHDCIVQTHFCEGSFDYDIVKRQHPHKSYVEVYQESGLIRPNKTLLVHGVSSNEKDLQIIKNNDVLFVHCPTALSDNPSDQNILIKDVLDKGINVGYGSDIGGSGTLNPFDNAIALTRYANIVATERHQESISIWDSLDIMMRINGCFFGNYGTIEVGKQFSVIIINDLKRQQCHPIHDNNRLLRFIYQGNINDIVYRIHDGIELRKPFKQY